MLSKKQKFEVAAELRDNEKKLQAQLVLIIRRHLPDLLYLKKLQEQVLQLA